MTIPYRNRRPTPRTRMQRQPTSDQHKTRKSRDKTDTANMKLLEQITMVCILSSKRDIKKMSLTQAEYRNTRSPKMYCLQDRSTGPSFQWRPWLGEKWPRWRRSHCCWRTRLAWGISSRHSSRGRHRRRFPPYNARTSLDVRVRTVNDALSDRALRGTNRSIHLPRPQ